jgi:hypothetical protein
VQHYFIYLLLSTPNSPSLLTHFSLTEPEIDIFCFTFLCFQANGQIFAGKSDPLLGEVPSRIDPRSNNMHRL